ncbi:MAG: family 43 glycosylhydrolase [Clostridia bacterium]|nr:family 43 glycosylhydrolase [Clostridia bacterium]
MKKIIVILAVLVTGLLLCVSAFAVDQPTVYVSPFGNDSNSGTLDAPLKSLYAAFRALPDGGKAVVCGAITVPATELPASNGLITVSSLDAEDYRVSAGEGGSGIIYLSGNVTVTSAVKFEYVDILTTSKNLVFLCNGNYACFGEGITVTTSGEDINHPSLVAGRTGATPADGTYLEVCSGTWYRVRGGSRGTSSAAQTGDTCLVIRGGTFTSTVDGVGDSATDGNVYMYIYGGTFEASVNGTSAAALGGNLTMSIYGGTFNSSLRVGRGGAVSGDVTVNLYTNPIKKIALGTSTVAGYISANVDGSIDVNTDLAVTYVSGKALEDLIADDTAFIKAAADAKLPKETGASLGSRDMSASGTVKKTEVNTLGQYASDISGDGKVTLRDAMTALKLIFSADYSENADINADGRISLTDVQKLIASAMANDASTKRESGTNIISDTLYLYGGASVADGKITEGYAFGTVSDNAYTLSSDVVLGENAVVGLYFGATATDPATADGYYFEVNTVKATVTLYSVTSGIYRVVAEENLHLLSNRATIRVTYGASTNPDAATLYFDDNGLVDEAYPKFDLSLAKLGDAVGLYVHNVTATLPVCVSEKVPANTDGYYQNNLFEQFTDPEVFYENGVYYFYGTRSSTQNKGVQCYSTTDFVTWKDEGFVLAHGDAFGDGVYKAANIVKYGDWYYMFYMAKSTALDTSVTAYASASSPTGPFKNADKTALTGDSNFIGGQPFVDDDGKFYLIYARTTGGNKLYGSEITLNGGKATIDLSTEKLLLEPTEPWENAKASVVECGYLVKHEGTYYLLYSGGNYNSTYGTGYATAESPLGPYTKYAYNPILTSNDQAFGVGAATIFTSPDGSEHFIAYLRNYSPTVVRPLLTCIDRIRFADNPNGGADILEMYGPTVNPQKLPSGLGESVLTDYQATRFHW